MKQRLYFFRDKLRLSDPWNYKVPVLISITYLVMLLGHITFFIALKYFSLSLITIVGIAGYAYLLNDWADIKKDLAAGKQNAMAGLPVSMRASLLFVFFVLAVLPWFFFPYTLENICLLGLELLLFVLYAAPPFRLKERPVAGVLVDALYAHALPCLLAALTFIAIARENAVLIIQLESYSYSLFLMLLAAWQFFLGIRNILLHQLEDMDNDMQSGTRTFATKYGKAVTEKWLLYFALPGELVFLAAFFIFLSHYTLIFVIGYLAYMIYLLTAKGGLALTIRSFCYNFLDDFYMDCFPLAALIPLILVNWKFVFLLLAHVFLFRNIVRALYRQYVLK